MPLPPAAPDLCLQGADRARCPSSSSWGFCSAREKDLGRGQGLAPMLWPQPTSYCPVFLVTPLVEAHGEGQSQGGLHRTPPPPRLALGLQHRILADFFFLECPADTPLSRALCTRASLHIPPGAPRNSVSTPPFRLRSPMSSRAAKIPQRVGLGGRSWFSGFCAGAGILAWTIQRATELVTNLLSHSSPFPTLQPEE